MKRLFLIAVLGLVGCGGGSTNSNPGGGSSNPPTPQSIDVTGSWEFIAHSSVDGSYSVIEANLTSQGGGTYFATQANTVFIQGSPDPGIPGFIDLVKIGTGCDAGQLGDVSFNFDFTSEHRGNFTLTDVGAFGNLTATGKLQFSDDGKSLVNGDSSYSVPASCGYAADQGTIEGVKLAPFSGTYSGLLFNTADAVIVTISQDASYGLSASGTDNGAAFTLTGHRIGGAFEVQINGTGEVFVGVYDPVGNDFLVYDSNTNFQGILRPGSNPQATVKMAVFGHR